MGDTKYVPVGDGTEVGLLKFLQNADVPIHTLIKDRFDKVVAHVPKSCEQTQFSACAVDIGDGLISLHIKGAPDVISSMCSTICGQAGRVEPMPLDANEGNLRSSFDAAVNEMAETPLRVIAFAHAEVQKANWEQQLDELKGSSANQVLATVLAGGPQAWLDIKLVGAVGLQDRVRPKVKSAIKHTRGAGIKVRLISGDMFKTAVAVALEVGLVKEEELPKSEYVAMEAARFDEEVGEATWATSDWPKFQTILKHLKVLAKASPRHKLLILKGLQKLEKKVAVTGAGIADVDTILLADIGLAMGSGCSAAKEVSDMILTDDDYMASLRAVMWGRNIYHNVGRFLQF